MKKIILVLAVLLVAAPAMAVVTITATQVGTTADVDITATTSGEGTMIPRAFALDITVDAGTITDVSGYFAGECDDVNRGYGIFPASFARVIDAGAPNWADVNYTPVAELGDLPSDTQGGIDTNGVTIEMGSLYVDDNSPPNPATLCTITVSGSCYVSLALNIGRGKIVMEDGNEPASVVLNGTAVTLVCIVPNVVNTAEAAAITAIENAGFVAGTPTYECNDVIVTVGNVISTTPGAGPATCGSTVEIVVSTGPCVVPTCMADTNPDYATWQALGEPNCWCYPRQCRGDADGKKQLLYWVASWDLGIFKSAFNKTEANIPPGGICADFDHKKQLLYWVASWDLGIFKQYFNKTEASVPTCGTPPDSSFNFWLTP